MKRIEMLDVAFGYTSDRIFEQLRFSADAGEAVVIYGENGSGKSTMLKLILGEIIPQRGEVRIMGQNAQMHRAFGDIGYVPQVQTYHHVTFPVTVRELVVMNLYDRFGLLRIPRRSHYALVDEVLEAHGLLPYRKTPFHDLSGGLKQRAMIARAMIRHPKVLILDEPTAGVDAQSKSEFLGRLADMRRNREMTILVVTHELELVRAHLNPDRIYRMEEGRLELA